ncbi:MAG: hypothetical protein M3Q58_00250 [Bacteroidota bacterium]|nr:hypothetical protein [Bacteroidota bacterium]
MTTFKASNSIFDKFISTETTPSNELLQQLLRLPRKELIRDLENVLTQIIHNQKTSYEQRLVPIHCIFLLTEIKSEGSLPLLIELCRQDDDFLFSNFSEHITETMFNDVLVMGKNNLNPLFDFLKDSDMKSSGTCIITDGLTQIALHYPELRSKIIAGVDDLYQHL